MPGQATSGVASLSCSSSREQIFVALNGNSAPMRIPRRYTVEGKDPFAAFTFVARTSRITNPDGSVVFEMKDLLAPESWSQVAVDVLAQKYFRKAGLPERSERVAEPGVPEWLQRSRPAASDAGTGQETDARQVFRRL